MKGKLERHRIIKEVVGNGKVASQEELAEILENKGIVVAQATLSRDIRDLGITKLHDGEGYYYSLPGGYSPRLVSIETVSSSSSIKSVEFTGHLAVLKTMPGHANMVASIIDAASLSEVAGTIAGDDTIFLAIREDASRDSLAGALGALFRGLEHKRVN
ncbi:MAG: ArgR family transcriptional regulator [Bacteroidales bacterium]|nr:ArgR family transcriptional regulator [Bacteroidales bacterium]MBO6221553.1 ArgR family transcriptional regulator [Bacteroidales bacterium]